MLNSISNKISNFKFDFIYPIILTFLFVGIICAFDLIIKVTPSDPLQYVGPSINPEKGFPFLDRLFLWYFIRFISFFGIPNEYLGGIATLTQTSILLFLILYWFNKKFDFLTSCIFFFIFLTNEYWLFYSTYTYPTQLLTLLTVGSIIVSSFIKSYKCKYFLFGVVSVFAFFSKVQGFGFIPFILIMIFSSDKKIINLKYYCAGFFSGLLLFIFIIYLFDDYKMFYKLYDIFFNKDVFDKQFKGRGLGNFPNFYEILKDPILLIGFLGAFYFLISKKSSNFKIFAGLAFSQILFLMFIYLVTSRGGPVIKNYFLESITIFLMVFTLLFSLLSKKLLLEFNYYNLSKAGISVVILGVLIFILNFFFFDQAQSFIKNYTNLIISSYSLALLIIFFIISLILNYLGFKKQFLIVLIIVFTNIFVNSNHLALKKVKFYLNWVEPYYIIANLIKSNIQDKNRNLIINTMLNRSTYNDAQVRIKRVAFQILRLDNKEYYLYLCEGSDCNFDKPNTSIITDNLDLIKLLEKEKFSKEILIDNKDNLSLTNTVYIFNN